MDGPGGKVHLWGASAQLLPPIRDLVMKVTSGPSLPRSSGTHIPLALCLLRCCADPEGLFCSESSKHMCFNSGAISPPRSVLPVLLLTHLRVAGSVFHLCNPVGWHED